MKNQNHLSITPLQLEEAELAGLKDILGYLWDGEQEAFNALLFIGANYKEWQAIFIWLKRNDIRGKKLVDLMQNESPDGGGYHMGVTYILSRLKGFKTGTVGIKGDELI